MNAIQGKIVSVKSGAKQRGLTRFTVQFKAIALLPERADVPAWLTDQVLTVQREVADPREIGGAGDAISLTTAESDKWLMPLVIEPATIDGKLPRTIHVTLRWWKNETPPPFTVSALGKKVSGSFVLRGNIFSAVVPAKDLLDADAPRPFEITVACDALRAICPVVSPADPGFCQFLDRRGEGYRLLNRWYAIDLVAKLGGAIVGFRERARNVDHVAAAPMTQKALDRAGHTDRVLIGNADKLLEAKLAFAVRQRETGTTRVEVEGVVDEGKNLRSAAAYQLRDGLPLLVLRRDARLGEAKSDEKKDDKKKEPTDSLVPLQLGFRYATMLDGDGVWGSQIIAPDGDRLGAIRAMFENDHAQRGEWRLKSGWALMHHPLRRQATLFLFDGGHPPELVAWAGQDFMTLEPAWLGRPYRPPGGAAFTLGLSAGEVCGAALDGAWVACQAPSDGNAIVCAAIAKLRDPQPDAVAEFQLGRAKRSAPLTRTFIEGVGEVHYAVVHFPAGRKIETLDAAVAGIPGRSKP
jgi:hypothetical protein